MVNEIVREYAAGLFALAREDGAAEEILAHARALVPLFTRDYRRLLSDPDIPKTERTSMVKEALGGRVHPYLVNFVCLMTERGLVSEIPATLAQYEELWCEENGVLKVKAESARELTDAQKERLAGRLSERTGRRILLEYAVNPSLIGGMRLFYDNRQIDDTVRRRLSEIAERLSDATV